MGRLHFRFACPALAAIAASAAPAAGQLIFGPASNVPAGNQPSGIATGDFDGDGDRDLATTADGPDRIVVLVNDGTGSYAAGPSTLLPASSSPQDVIAAKLDGDPVMDLAVAVRDPQGSILILSGNGNGTFTLISTVTVGDRPRGLSAGDVDSDGDTDLAVANRDGGTASVALNDGAGSFTVETVNVGTEPRDTALADFDGDGDMDLAVTEHDSRSIGMFANSGGSFSLMATLLVNPLVRPDGVVAADLDNDGDVDIATATNDATLGINQAAVFLNTAMGFTMPTGYDTGGTNTSGIATADLDCDGLLDLVTTNQDSNDVSMLRNTGGGAFGAPQVIGVGTTPGELGAADFDGDDDADVATANRDSNDVSVLINDTCIPCPWDIDGDGIVGINDFLDLLAAWGPNPGHPADFDGDGVVGIGDFLALLANWGGCP